MATQNRILLLIACILPAILAQICNCPLEPVLTTTASCAACPTGGTLSLTTTYIAGQCRNFRVTTTTTTRTIGANGQVVCNCPTAATTTETATCDCPLVSATVTSSVPSIECPWGSTATRTITQYGTGNSTSHPSSGNPIGSVLAYPTASAAPPAPTPLCALQTLPAQFHLFDSSQTGYLAFDPSCNKTHACPYKADATLFHANETDPDDLTGVPQLSLYATNPSTGDEIELGAYAPYNGGEVVFFAAGDVPEDDGLDWYIVTVGFSAELCELSLVAYGLRDLSTVESCGGVLALGYGIGQECPEVRVAVEAA